MRTTINLPDELLDRLKQLAAASGTTMTALIQDAVRESLARRRRTRPAAAVRLTTYRGTGLQPGVDLDDSAALYDLMDAPSGAARR
jgi:hypothetical protein